jgi:hypothetical protein
VSVVEAPKRVRELQRDEICPDSSVIGLRQLLPAPTESTVIR